MRIVLNSYVLEVQEGDEIAVSEEPCPDCGSHTEISVYRNHKKIAYFGDAVRIFEPEKLDYGDVVVPRED